MGEGRHYKEHLPPGAYTRVFRRVVDERKTALHDEHKHCDTTTTTAQHISLPGLRPLQLYVPPNMWLPSEWAVSIVGLLGLVLGPFGSHHGSGRMAFFKLRGAPLQALLVNGPCGGTPRVVSLTTKTTIHASQEGE